MSTRSLIPAAPVAAKARTVTRVSGALLQRKCACGGSTEMEGDCEECKKKKLQRKAVGNGPATAPPIVHEVLRSPGQPLDTATRSFFEPRFGHDFSKVRVHTDDKAARSARAVNAEAYTVSSNLVFDTERYRPHTMAGRQLLAHELTHVAQQESFPARSTGSLLIDPDSQQEAEANAAASAVPASFSSTTTALQPSLQRAPKSGGGAPAAPHITQIVVNQNSTQRVTATFSDGHTESDICSTGKGHCCFDASSGTAEGGACSAARSIQVGNNCTPIGDFTVTTKIPVTSSQINFWTQFHDAKSVALHEYSPVSGEPLSHGCVRLHTAMARTIFDGSIPKVTKVRVEGLARPSCDDAKLQAEWRNDFKTAGTTPPDGQTVDPLLGRRLTREEIASETHNIRETRSELESALGVNDRGLTATLLAGVQDIPRCVPARTNEEQQRSAASSAGVPGAAASTQAAGLKTALNKARNAAGAERAARQFGEQLWQDATKRARAGGSGTDDRQLYWTRLEMTTIIRDWDPSWTPNADTLRRLHENLLNIFEQTSRGMTTASFPGAASSTSKSGSAAADPSLKRILVSGFDPFGFQSGGDIRQSNLSGAAALALDGETLTDGGISARVESVVYPVRYADFNAGMVEKFLMPQLTGPTPPDFVVSISQGGSQFELEEWAGRRRSTAGFQDNLGTEGGGTPTNPVEPPGIGAGPEFQSTTVSKQGLTSMRQAVGRSSAIPEETTVKDLPSGATSPRTLPAGPGGSPGLAVEGSGGGFLSNEIYYRNLQTGSGGPTIPMVHLHTPTLPPGASDAARNALIDKIRNILKAALAHI